MASPTTDRRLGLVGNTAIKAPVDCATTANITLAGEQTIDGVLTSSSRVLVKNQTNAVENGIYDSGSGAWTRARDFNGNYDVVKGTLVGIAGGTQQDGAYYEVTTANPIAIGSSAITFAASVATGSLATQLANTSSALYGAGMIGYDADLAYAANTAGQKLNQWISITDYGAVSGQNCTTAINDAIAAATILNKAVYFPAGTWYIDSTIVWSRGVNWYGEGVEASIISANSFPSASGDPMLTITSSPDWFIRDICFNGADKASGIHATTAYWGRMEKCQLINIKGKGVWLEEAANTVLDQVSMYYFTSATDVGLYVDGGSATMTRNCHFNTEAIGVSANTATASGLACHGTSFEGNVTAVVWPLGQNPLQLINCYFEGLVSAQTTCLIGTTGAGAKPDVVFRGCIVASTLNNAVSISLANSVVWEDNLCGKNVDFTNGIDNLYFYGANTFVASAPTISAQLFHQQYGSINKHGSAGDDSRTLETNNTTLGSHMIAYDEAETGYRPRTEDAQSWEWRASGSTSAKMSLTGSGVLSNFNKIYPGTAAGVTQSSVGIYGGSTVPSSANGSNGDIAFILSTGTTGTMIYHKRGGTWVGIV